MQAQERKEEEICSGSWLESQTAVVRCGSGGSRCVSDDSAQAEDVSMVSTDARLNAGEEILFFVSQSEDQSQFWNVTNNTLLQVVRKKFGRPRAGSAHSVCKPVCGNGDVLFPLAQKEFAGSPAPQIFGRDRGGGEFGPTRTHLSMCQCMSFLKCIDQRIVDVPVPQHFR